MTIDIGAGDGRAVIATALAEPTSLVIGLDADAASMVESSRRAVRGRVSNALFVVAAAEALPAELVGIAERVTIRFPWGSLLRGCLGLDNAVTAGIASLARDATRIPKLARRATFSTEPAPEPGCSPHLELLLAPNARDGLAGMPTEPGAVVRAAAAAFAPYGFELVEGRPATAEEVAASRSTWAKRLLRGGTSLERPVTLVRLRSSPR